MSKPSGSVDLVLTGPSNRYVTLPAAVSDEVGYLCIPTAIASSLGLEVNSEEYRSIDLNGEVIEAAYVGPIRIDCNNDYCYSGAIVCGDRVVLGTFPSGDLNVAHKQRVN